MPKKGTASLFDLIQSLDKAEKRYFKLYAGSKGADANMIYLKLFDAVEQQKEYNEREIVKQIQPPSKKQFSTTKRYLHDLILHSLRDQRSRFTVAAELRTLLDWSEILFDKMLYKQCRNMLVKAKKLAYKYELYNFIAAIIDQEYKIAFREYDTDAFNSLQEQEARAAELISGQNRYRNRSVSFWKMQMKMGAARKAKDISDISDAINDPILKNEKSVSGFYSKRYLYNSYFLYHLIRGDQKKCFEFSKKSVDMYLHQPHHIRQSAEYFLGQLNNLLIACANRRMFPEMNFYIRKLKEVSLGLKGNANPITAFFYRYHELNYYINTGAFSEGIPVAGEIGEQMKKYERFLSPLQKATLWMGIAQISFGNGNYRQALSWLNHIHKLGELEVRKDILVLTKIFYLMLSYEMGDKPLSTYLQRNAKNYMSTRNRLYKLEKVMLHFFSKVILKARSKNERAQAFRVLKDKLTGLNTDPLEKNAFDDFDYLSWVESKIEGRPLAEIVKEKIA